ncbi:hypothetical protein BU26DRAFT_519528 [Trematosphaeria pertusa]|uniref:Uncharacterized protein n=1 Tax=Trematosphaeria pertusa TaxID=390896 RepID=A0A6A6IGD5_9PLEO|nr:uncharacterized protein BU26DRAFT_519528 [Trematosphaeria pertusa]KAF2249471.1 hypothetical protein BU26DRAFT_519528 [Trematosphaeria pertusa]
MSRSENATTPTVSKNPAAPAPTGPEKKRTEVTAPAILSPTPSQTTASPSASDNPVTQSPSALKFPGSVETIKITTAEPMKQQAKKARTQSPVVEQEVDDLLQMSRPHRQTLFEGPQMVIYVGEKSVPNVAKRAAMAASRMLNDHFRKKPESLEYSFEAGFVDLAAIRTLLVTWPLQSSKEFQAGEVPFQDTFEENMALLRAARFLGMERYTKTILKYHLDYLKTSLPEYSEIDTVERMATSDKDPLWTSMVNHLTHSRFKGFIPDPEEFAAFLDKHPKLKAAMEAADEFFKNSAAKEREKKDQRRPAEQKAGENARHQRWQKNKKRRERESATAESL